MESNWPSVVSFLLGDEPELPPTTIAAQSKRAKLAYSSCLFIWPVMLAIILALFWISIWIGGPYHWPAVLYSGILLWLFFQF